MTISSDRQTDKPSYQNISVLRCFSFLTVASQANLYTERSFAMVAEVQTHDASMTNIEGKPVDFSYKSNPYHVTYDIESTPDLFTLAMIHENGLSFIFFGYEKFDKLLSDDEIMDQSQVHCDTCIRSQLMSLTCTYIAIGRAMPDQLRSLGVTFAQLLHAQQLLMSIFLSTQLLNMTAGTGVDMIYPYCAGLLLQLNTLDKS